ncbi:DUF397 domain-containing protein [Streptomyces sp. p1417]|uniref:DUF397 domain-containing protein n=1 Tax=Streptomyces typhae TaxID=2681492 RepID=A0A6L6WRJ9_9ACTN|nr:DUF397 domain-containing protein [Streptomyces typhae]MVO84730.1 DUF397 domain-containing protein [Streptomyces typhae]
MNPRHTLHWFTSSYSGGSGTECVEVALVEQKVLVRDSKRPSHTRLEIAGQAWSGFLLTLRTTSQSKGSV